ncbi:hypothetical protein D1871_03460 [Nakamurella silvestris]|nr:hypothetical protein D1871_03460 [Nakamurella silvestris]
MAEVDSVTTELELTGSTIRTPIVVSGRTEVAKGRVVASESIGPEGANYTHIIFVDGVVYGTRDPASGTFEIVTADTKDQQLRAMYTALLGSTNVPAFTSDTLILAKDLREVGVEKINGSPVRKYTYDADLTAIDSSGLAESNPQMAALLRGLLNADRQSIPYQLWVDDEGRQVRLVQEITTAGVTVATSITFGDFNTTEKITAPDASQIVGG